MRRNHCQGRDRSGAARETGVVELPVGTVTLVFTDIEGSTRLLETLGPEQYIRALEDHRRLLREAFTAHGGVEVEMQFGGWGFVEG